MFVRDIYPELLKHLRKRQVTVITGMRRVGKSTAVKFLLQETAHSNYLYLDCERIEIRTLLNAPDYEGIKGALEIMGINFEQPAIIALDEIQLVENLPSVIKYLYDTYAIKFIVTGSSSYYMRNQFSESLAGRKRIFEMYPLSFGEFLLFKRAGKGNVRKYAWKSFSRPWFNKYQLLYAEYIRYGGFPEVVLEDDQSDKIEILKDIINSFIELDVKLLSDYSATDELYKLVKLLAARSGSKVDYTKISSVSGINRQKIASYIQLLEHTYVIYQATPFTRNRDKEISHQTKVYFSDTGILHVLGGDQLSTGQIFENAVAIQLKTQGSIQYFQKKSGQEIDFIFNSDTAIEVKATPIEQDQRRLIHRASQIGIDKTHVIGLQAPYNGFTDFIWGGNVF